MDYKFINTEYLEMVSGGDISIMKELVSIFRDQVVEISTEMRTLLKNGDFHSLGMLSHKAKSSVAIMGMNEVALMLKNFELEAKEGKGQENYNQYINRFEQEAKSAVKELDYFLANR
jgi:HPt (histidine-containing phosphotransfer) domain-containing protein